MTKNRYIALILGSSLAVAGSAFAGVALAGADCDKAAGHMGGRGGAHFERLDADKDGKISLAELTTTRETWLAKVDTNRDGVATQEEIAASMAAHRQERHQKLFERDDANKDGRLTRDETKMPAAWFERADANEDGALTLAELNEAGKSFRGEKKADKAGREGRGAGKARFFDRNGDGKVDREELRSSAQEQFTRLDTNKDGSLTRDEFRTHGHRKHRRGGGEGARGPAKAPAPTRS